MSLKYFLLLIVLDAVYSDCLVDIINDIHELSPVIRTLPHVNQIFNSNTSTIIIKDHERVFFVCSGSNNMLSDYHTNSITAECQGQNLITWTVRKTRRGDFIRGVDLVSVGNLRCSRTPEFEVQQTSSSCELYGREILITYSELGNDIKICYDQQTQRAIWTKHVYQPLGYNWMLPNPQWRKDGLDSGIDVDAIYHREVDLTIGHLVPPEDFHTAAEKRMTYAYVNSAPQLAKFDIRNWFELEAVIRSLNKKLTIYTGTHGVRRFLHGNDTFPLPAYFWKVVINYKLYKDVAFIGVNDDKFDGRKLCTDICDSLQWLGHFNESRKNVTHGYIYCCSFSEFKTIGFDSMDVKDEYYWIF